MPKYLAGLSRDLRTATLTNGQIVPVHSLYNGFKPTRSIYEATLAVVGPFTDADGENQYVNADLTGEMNLYTH